MTDVLSRPSYTDWGLGSAAVKTRNRKLLEHIQLSPQQLRVVLKVDTETKGREKEAHPYMVPRA